MLMLGLLYIYIFVCVHPCVFVEERKSEGNWGMPSRQGILINAVGF